ncbi:MAG: preprotein translocase subunit SecG [Gammaproteobacteria bacterium]|nr:preprotein translocase subunit SecG [Gammaproteobacteria bacterium]
MNLDVILLILQVFMAVAIIGLILLQKGKGASEGATFGGGGGGAGSVFGASGSSNFLSKSTAILATCFFLNSIALAYLAGHREAPASVIDTIEVSSEAAVVTDQAAESFGGVPMPADVPVESDVPAAVDAPVESDVPPAAE